MRALTEGPAGPAAPVAPCGPCAPAAPAAPDGPCAPCGPCGPWGPAGPTSPRSPLSPFGPWTFHAIDVSVFAHLVTVESMTRSEPPLLVQHASITLLVGIVADAMPD